MCKTNNLIELRDMGIHASTRMLLAIVRKATRRSDSAFVGEIHAYYQEHRKADTAKFNYGYAGMGNMLSVMAKRGYLVKTRQGRYPSYALSELGESLLAKC